MSEFEYPRPQLVRRNWTSLNGPWRFRYDDEGADVLQLRHHSAVELVQRQYDRGTERNYSGPIVKAIYTWTPTGKLTVSAALSKVGAGSS